MVLVVVGVVCLGIPTVLAAAGYVAWTQFMGAAEAPEGGLLTVINQREGVLAVDCGPDGSFQVDPAGSGTHEVGSRPARCLGKLGDEPVMDWATEEPPRADETWTVVVPPSIAVAGVEPPPVEPLTAAEPVAVGEPGADPAVAPPPDPVAAAPEQPASPPASASTTKPTSTASASKPASTTKPASASTGTTKPAPASATTTSGTTTTTTKPPPASATSSSASSSASTASSGTSSSGEDEGLLTAVRVEWAKGAKKSKSAEMWVDGKKVGTVPTKKLVKTGMHSLDVTSGGEGVLSCSVAASGKDIVLWLDLDAPKCP